MNESTKEVAPKSLERIQHWWKLGQWRAWIGLSSAQGQKDALDRGSLAPVALESSPPTAPSSLRSMAGPSDEDLERIERGSIPSLIDVPESVESAPGLRPTVRPRDERPADESDDPVAEANIGHELAQRMLHHATSDE